GFDAVSTANSSNVFAPSTKATLSLRVSPAQDPQEAADALVRHLRNNVPFGAHFKATVLECGPGFKADINSKGAVAFAQALKEGFGADVVYSGIGGSIPFTNSLKQTFPNADILVSGVEDPDSCAHSDNESVHLGSLKKVIVSEALLLEKLSNNN
ncbi:MAG: dipeptidase, partial [Candidatus Ancillula sp.]|nr:dipeptidase [Candidatus Ancillula sp.]